MGSNWTRIPVSITSENDRRAVIAILADYGLEVRRRDVKVGTRIQRGIEFREQTEDAEKKLRRQ